MALLEPLPDAITHVSAPSFVSPSALSYGGDCSLRIILSSQRDVPKLDANPAAELGKIAHQLMERAVRGQIERSGSSREDVSREFDALLEKARIRLGSDEKAVAYSDLSLTLSPLAWRRKRMTIINIATKMLETSQRAPSTSRSPRKSLLSYETLPRSGRWSEVDISVPSLHLRGRMDIVEKSHGKVIIKDLKSGRVEDREGHMLPYVDRQMKLYGAMAYVHTPDTEIKLIVDDGKEHEVSFNREIIENTLTLIGDFVRELPSKGERIEAEKIAHPGADCMYCSYRHVCSSYHRGAVSWWVDEPGHRIPLDTWGTLEEVFARTQDIVDLVIRDNAGRKVKVFGVDRKRLPKRKSGASLWFFGLRTFSSIVRTQSSRHPLNFYETPEDNPNDRAWSLRMFVEYNATI